MSYQMINCDGVYMLVNTVDWKLFFLRSGKINSGEFYDQLDQQIKYQVSHGDASDSLTMLKSLLEHILIPSHSEQNVMAVKERLECVQAHGENIRDDFMLFRYILDDYQITRERKKIFDPLMIDRLTVNLYGYCRQFYFRPVTVQPCCNIV